jgi:tetratricopeptide (TPR) repeat protein
MNFDRLIQARGELRALTADAPRYAPGWAGLSHALSLSGFVDMPPRDASTLARATALRALALDSTLMETRYALITYEMFARWDLALARARLDSALSRDPDDPELSNIHSAWERWNGHLDEAIALKSKALALQPTSVLYADQVAYNLYLAHRCEESAERLQRAAAAFDDAPLLYEHLYRALRCVGRDADAIDALEEALRQRGDTGSASLISRARGDVARDGARRAVFRARLDRLLRQRRRGWVQANFVTEAYAELRDTVGTLAWLDSAYAEGSFYLHDVPFDPLYDFVRGDARFERFIRALPWHPSLAYADVKLARR